MVTQQASQIRGRLAPGPVVGGVPALPVPQIWLLRPRLALLALVLSALVALLGDILALSPMALSALVLVALLAMAAASIRSQARSDAARVQSYGQYTLVRKLGEGGMGVVYEAKHALLRRPTALKLLRAQAEGTASFDAEALSRFEREVQLTSQLTHPNTIIIYDYGRNDEGVFYYAMEYIDGIDLERLVRVAGPLAPAHVIHLALQVCGSLGEAHARALIHRDIKPGNLFVYERAGVLDTVKVLDFGLVKSLHGPVVSAAHVLVGTPLYTAPEVMRDPSSAGVRSDIYGLGAVLHWLATGKTVQEAALLAPTALAALPLDLERLIMRCTESDPCDRPESMEALASELGGCRDAGRWSAEDSRAYWEDRGKRLSRVLSEPAAPGANTLQAS